MYCTCLLFFSYLCLEFHLLHATWSYIWSTIPTTSTALFDSTHTKSPMPLSPQLSGKCFFIFFFFPLLCWNDEISCTLNLYSPFPLLKEFAPFFFSGVSLVPFPYIFLERSNHPIIQSLLNNFSIFRFWFTSTCVFFMFDRGRERATFDTVELFLMNVLIPNILMLPARC